MQVEFQKDEGMSVKYNKGDNNDKPNKWKLSALNLIPF